MIEYTPIHQLLQRSSQHHTIIGEQSNYRFNDWLHRVATWRATLITRPEQRFALFHPDAGEFSAILFALWSLNKVACLPANRQAGTLQALTEHVDAFVGDFQALVSTVKLSLSDHPAPIPAVELNTELTLLEVYTSGSSGEAQCISKNLRQLSEEVSHLHQLWAAQLNPVQVLATVSHQHVYGLLFKVLWPLAEGWPLVAQSLAYWEQLGHYTGLDNRLLLVSSPTHLTRIPNDINAHSLAAPLIQVFSSGAPLLRAASLQAQQQLQTTVTEVYGSTETGGIGWRRQTPEQEAAWLAMPEVQLRQAPTSGCLSIRSTHLADPHSWFTTADRVSMIDDHHFHLLGRIDRIVKVEGKRLSLDELERHLSNHPDITQAKVLLLNGPRYELGAVIELANKQLSPHNAAARRALSKQFKDYLLHYVEAPLLPRRWRFIKTWPVNTEGKIPNAHLQDLFMREAAKALIEWPVITATEQPSSTEITLQLLIPEQLRYFDGHFPGTPILPGVVQVHWAEHYAQQHFTIGGAFQCIEVLKFQKVIQPLDTVTLLLRFDEVKQKVHFAYRSNTDQHASGRLVYEANA